MITTGSLSRVRKGPARARAGGQTGGHRLPGGLDELSFIMRLVQPMIGRATTWGKLYLAPQNLSRLCADSGTVTSPLVPWNSCGAFMGSTLGVATLLYLPFCFFNLISPVLSVVYGFTGFKIVKNTPDPESQPEEIS